MKKALSLSLVIPVYNEEGYLRACLDAVAAQTRLPDEVIVVDNNSTDGSVALARTYPFVTVIAECRQGSPFAQEAGFDAATGDIIGRIDADTVLSPDWCAQVEKTFQERPSVQAATGNCMFYDIPLARAVHVCHLFVYYMIQKTIARTQILWGSNMAIRRSAWLAVRGQCNIERGINEDIDLSINLHKLGLDAAWVRTLKVGVSMRRGDLTPRSLIGYMRSWHQNYQRNDWHFRSYGIYALKTVVLALVLPLGVAYAIFNRLSDVLADLS